MACLSVLSALKLVYKVLTFIVEGFLVFQVIFVGCLKMTLFGIYFDLAFPWHRKKVRCKPIVKYCTCALNIACDKTSGSHRLAQMHFCCGSMGYKLSSLVSKLIFISSSGIYTCTCGKLEITLASGNIS